MLYVCLHKTTKEVHGVAEIGKGQLSYWKKKFKLEETTEEYRGKMPHEVKYEQGKIRLATQSEITTYLQEQENQENADEKASILSVIGLTQADIDKIKALP